jgi:oligopeptide/dipeptide ABC transporter ATP-binding protein
VSALDLSVQAQVINLLARLARDRGLAYLFISHDLSVVRHVADEIAVLFAGQVVEQGPADVVADSPAHPYTRALVLAAPVPDPVAQRERRVLRRAGRRGLAGDATRDLTGCRFAPRCPFATDLCRAERPPLLPRASGVSVACHRYDEIAGAGQSSPVELDDVVQEHLAGDPGIDVLETGATGRRLLLDHLDRTFARFGAPVPAVAREASLDVPVPAARSLRPATATDHVVRVRVYHPQPGTALPVHVLLHGGAWVSGSGAEQFTVASARHRARGAQCAVVTVDYALAPEHPWPTALDDVRAVLRHLIVHAAELDLQPGAASLGGVSAGANLAVAAVLAGLDVAPRGLVLEVPALDLTAGTVLRHEAGLDVSELTRPVGAYLAGRVDVRNPLVSPLLAPRLAALPPTWVFDAGADPLRHDAQELCDRLRAEGVEVHHVRTEGALHGSMLLTGSWQPACHWQEAVTAAVLAVHRGDGGER